LVVADLNGDGIPDLAVLTRDSPSTVQIWFGNRDGTFKAGPTYAVGRYARSMAIGDFNGDGLPDLVVANTGIRLAEDMTVSVLVNRGDGTFQGDCAAGQQGRLVAGRLAAGMAPPFQPQQDGYRDSGSGWASRRIHLTLRQGQFRQEHQAGS
jgi:hypothetical protein